MKTNVNLVHTLKSDQSPFAYFETNLADATCEALDPG